MRTRSRFSLVLLFLVAAVFSLISVLAPACDACGQSSPSFVSYIQVAENSTDAGWHEGLWHPVVSPEGGSPTIAYGHKLKAGEDFASGITHGDALKLLNTDIADARHKAKTYFDKRFGASTWPSMSESSREIATDFAFNLGSCSAFPNLMSGLATDNGAIIRREYKRYWTDESGHKRELTERNRLFYERYVSGDDGTVMRN